MRIENIEEGKLYKNWKEVCDDLDIDYSKSVGRTKRSQLDELELYYIIEKKGYKMSFILRSKDIIKDNLEKDRADNLISDRFNQASKLFQAGLVRYLTRIINEDELAMSVNTNMYGLLRSLNMLSPKHHEIRYCRKDNKHQLNYIDKKVSKTYYEKYYSDVISLYERGMDNLSNKGIMKYYKGHNISYKVYQSHKVVKDEFLDMGEDLIEESIAKGVDESIFYKDSRIVIDEVDHEFTDTVEEEAVFDGKYNAWLLVKDVFSLDYNVDKNDKNINYFVMFNEGVNGKCKVMEDVVILKNMDDEKRSLFERFFNNKNVTLYTLFRDLSCIYIARQLEKTMFSKYEDVEVEVERFYTAYNIFLRRQAFQRYHQEIIEGILTNGDKAEVNAGYIVNRMYSALKNKFLYNKSLLMEITAVCSYVSNVNEKQLYEKYEKELLTKEDIEMYDKKEEDSDLFPGYLGI